MKLNPVVIMLLAGAISLSSMSCATLRTQMARQSRPSMTVLWKSGPFKGSTTAPGGHIFVPGRTSVALELIPDGNLNVGKIEIEYDGRLVRTIRNAPYRASIGRLNGLRPLIIRADYEDFFGIPAGTQTFMLTINARK